MSDYLNDDRSSQHDDDGEDPIFTRLKGWITAGWRKRSDWRTEAKKSYDYVAGHQWSQEDLDALEEQKRPAVTFNRCAAIIKAICGLEVNNRQGVVYLPRKLGEASPDDAITATAKWVRDECNAEDEESDAFRDMTICGEGWIETTVDYNDKVAGAISERRVDPLEMIVNAGACRSNYDDGRMVARVREMDIEDARELIGDESIPDEDLHAAWFSDDTMPEDGGEGNKKDYPDKTRDGIDGKGLRRKVRLIHVQWWDREPRIQVAQPGVDKLQELTPEEFKTFSDRMGQMKAQAQQSAIDAANDPMADPTQVQDPAQFEFQSAEIKKKCYYEAFLGLKMLGAPIKLKKAEFQFRAMTGQYDRKKKYFYGITREMFDPQMWANKWLSQTMQILNSNAKGGIMAEEDAFKNIKKAETDWADPTKIVLLRSGAIAKQKVKERPAAQLPQGLSELMQFALGSLRDVTGVNLELLGQADREQASSLEAQRRQSAMTTLATLFNALRRFRKSQGRLLLHYIQLLPDGMLIRVLSQGQMKYMPLVKSEDVEMYDIIIDEAPSSPDQKMMVWQVTLSLIQAGVPLPPPALIRLLKYSPYPESVVNEILDGMGMGAGGDPPEMVKQKLQQAEQALQVMENELKQALADKQSAQDDRSIEVMQVQIQDYIAETGRLALQVKGLTDAAKIHNDNQQQNADRATAAEGASADRTHDTVRTALTAATAAVPAQEAPPIDQSNIPTGGADPAMNDRLQQLEQLVQQLLSQQQPPQGASQGQPPQGAPPAAPPAPPQQAA